MSSFDISYILQSYTVIERLVGTWPFECEHYLGWPWLLPQPVRGQRFFSSLVNEPHQSQWAAIDEVRSVLICSL
jgi:hypothetical protein